MRGARGKLGYRFDRLLSAAGVSLQPFIIGGCQDDETANQPMPDASPAALVVRQPVDQWLIDITHESGLNFIHESGAEGHHFTPEITGPGCALFDFDNDGDLDAYLINGNWSLSAVPHDDRPTNRLYQQNSDGMFVDVTESSGLGDPGYGMGSAIGDIDNDGDLDVVVTNLGPDQLYQNNGDGTFTNTTMVAGINEPGWSASAAFLDYDRDGWLDLYIVRYLDFNTVKRCFDAAGRPDYCAPNQFPPLHDLLFRNNGNGTFTDVSAAAGITQHPQRGLGVSCADFNDDGWIDVYVANDGDPNQLWINQRDGTFRDMAVALGAAFDIHGRPQAGMGTLAVDLDGDLSLDIFVTNFSGETNTLYVNRGPELGFDDRSASSGLLVGCVDFTGFGVEAIDLELDGDVDIAIVNGATLMQHPHPGATQPSPWNRYAEPKLAYLNDGSGQFAPAHPALISWRDEIEISRGLVAGDIDNDGDLDLLVSNVQGAARLYRNDAPRSFSGHHWLAVRCVDPRLNRDAIGANVTVNFGQHRVLQTITAVGSYMSARQPFAHVGLESQVRVDAILVRWPDGLVEQFGPFRADQKLVLVRGSGVAQ